jgi:hypothetical protein
MKGLLYIGLLLVPAFLHAGPITSSTSPFNNRMVQTDSTGNYSFIISGHFYGDGTNKTGYPANTLLANIDKINQSDACMLVCLGDLFMDVKNDIPKYRTSLFDKLEVPLFNAVGNHDLSGTVYQEHFSATNYMFNIGNDVHVILDTERDNGDIKDDQLQMLQDLADKAAIENYDHVFIYAHRTVWQDAYTELDGLFEDNTQSIAATNFKDEVLPVISKMAKHTKVHWFAGSLGNAPASFFYFPDEKNKITYIATAIRALPRDAILWVHVNNGEVTFETESLTGQSVEPLEHYNVEYWKATSAAEPFNYRLIPLYIKNILLSRPFWYGMGFAFVLVISFKWMRRRWNRTKV